MRRYLQLTITEPYSPTIEEELAKATIECATIGIDLAASKVTLPGGFVCSLDSLSRIVYEMETAQRMWMRSGQGPWRTGRV